MNQEEHIILIKFKTTMLKSSLYDYSDASILVKGNITVNNKDQYNNIIMEYQKITNLLGNSPNQPSKFRSLG